MNRRALLAAALALPLAGLGWSWFSADRMSRTGAVWLVAVEGYDPRDYLQGHYVEYRYLWPGLADPPLGDLCLHGSAPRIERVSVPAPGADCPNRVRGDLAGGPVSAGTVGGRIYLEQQRATEYQQRLVDGRHTAVLRFRLRGDGQAVPLELVFVPRR